MSHLVPDWLYLRSAPHRSKVALVLPDSGQRITYQELAEGAARVAGGLRELGVGEGDRVATLALNGCYQLELLFACARIGAILVPLNYRLSESELSWIGASAAPSVLCSEQEFATQARSVARAAGARTVALDNPASGEVPYAALKDAEPALALPVTQEMPWYILYTGGTTSRPKGAILTHGSVLWNAINTNLSWGLREDDRAPVCTPMFHTCGLNVFTLPLLLLGGTLIVPRRFEPEQALRCLIEERATLLFLVPSMFQRLAETPGFDTADLSSVRWALSGGAPWPPRLFDLYRPKVRILKQAYGLTEAGPNIFALPDATADWKRGSVGRPTLLVRTRVVDPAGRDLPPGEIGELLLAGPMVCAGYWQNREDTDRAFDGEWFHTGDLVRCDRDGYFYVVDRKNDLIVTGGENVYPSEIEEVLCLHPAVSEAAVVGVPDARWGEIVVAVLALRPEACVTAEELTAQCRARLAGYKVPRRFEIWPRLPRSAGGEIVRAAVRRQLISSATESEPRSS